MPKGHSKDFYRVSAFSNAIDRRQRTKGEATIVPHHLTTDSDGG